MLYDSTRGLNKGFTAAEAIRKGLASDGGLFIPQGIPTLSLEEIKSMLGMSYNERAKKILALYLDDYTEAELDDCVDNAYNTEKFDSSDIAELYKLHDRVGVLELWHGPTAAFKDMALQILPRFLVKAIEKSGDNKETVILVATSGDTGKAALEGFRDVKGTKIIVFYPENGVSQVQKKQMVTQEGSNVAVVAVNGNFDDAQNGVKAVFNDQEFEHRVFENDIMFSSANSINWGRLVPQIIYYFSGYLDMVNNGQIEFGDKINVVVPTGNFGNILAGYFAKLMGLPVNKFICASNDNNILFDFIEKGVYDRNREFYKTISPSMDILISSNLERLIYLLCGKDTAKVNQWMAQLNSTGKYSVTEDVLKAVQQDFYGDWASEDETMKIIAKVYEQDNYVIDTHTAVAFSVYEKYVQKTGDSTKTMIVSTASPFKFAGSVCKALFSEDELAGKSEFELLKLLSERCNIEIPKGLRGLEDKKVIFDEVCEKNQFESVIASKLF